MKQIILIGPKHSGKTSAGKVLASLLVCGFIDLDEEITKMIGKTPRELYNEDAAVFQKAEADNLSALVPLCDVILATGGGIIDNTEAVRLLKEIDAVKVYLNISAETAWQRISSENELPPFLQTDNPQETHRVLHERRAAAYRQLADITVNVEGKTPPEIAKEIVSNLR